MNRKFPCVESISHYIARAVGLTEAIPPYPKYNTFKVRVWREEEVVQNTYDTSDIGQLLYDTVFTDRVAIVEAVAAMPRVNAVEVVEEVHGGRSGIVVYVEWP